MMLLPMKTHGAITGKVKKIKEMRKIPMVMTGGQKLLEHILHGIMLIPAMLKLLLLWEL